MWNPHLPLGARQRRILGLCGVALVLVAWSLVAGLGLVGRARLPAPWDVAGAFVTLAWDGERGQSLLLQATLASVSRVAVAAFLAVLLGVPLGVIMGASPRINAFLSPMLDPFRSAPIVAVLPILVMWLGIGESMKVAFLWLGAFVYLVPMVRDAIRAVPQVYFVKSHDLGATPLETIWHSVFPMAWPRIFDAVIVAVSIMWTYITVAEYVNADRGLGQLIQNARRFSAMDQVFVGIFVIILLALLTFQGMTWVRRRLFPWETES
jgi:ABC-type nitrate/sulfonate/bicarbonate transport system permease component